MEAMTFRRAYIRLVRYAVQAAFLLLSIQIGYRFHLFIRQFLDPSAPPAVRPPSVDAFMPIAGFMSFKYFLLTGIVEPIHPAALIMFLAIVGVSLLLKKGFCGWICPIGTISQYAWMLGEKVFGRNFRMSPQVDIPLRSLKYVLMGLFVFLIGIAMTPNMMILFFITDYYKTIDVRTMHVFTRMSALTFWVLLGLTAFSFVYKNFWCRYLCPYGALLGLVSMGSPVKVRRNVEKCTHCRTCSRMCPSLLDVEQKEVVHSPECFGCMTCVSSCPAEGALDVTVKAGQGRRRILRPLLYPVLLLTIFYAVMGAGMALDKWHSPMDREEYARVITALETEGR